MLDECLERARARAAAGLGLAARPDALLGSFLPSSILLTPGAEVELVPAAFVAFGGDSSVACADSGAIGVEGSGIGVFIADALIGICEYCGGRFARTQS